MQRRSAEFSSMFRRIAQKLLSSHQIHWCFSAQRLTLQQLRLTVKSCASGMESMNANIHSSQENCSKATDRCVKPFLLRMLFLDATPRALHLEPKGNAKAWNVHCKTEITKKVLGVSNVTKFDNNRWSTCFYLKPFGHCRRGCVVLYCKKKKR